MRADDDDLKGPRRVDDASHNGPMRADDDDLKGPRRVDNDDNLKGPRRADNDDDDDTYLTPISETAVANGVPASDPAGGMEGGGWVRGERPDEDGDWGVYENTLCDKNNPAFSSKRK